MFLRELGIKLTKPTTHLLAWIMLALLEKTAAHLFRLAEKLPDDDTTDMARRQKIRRFMSNHRIFPRLFLHAFVTLVRPLFRNASVLELVMDRTEWRKRGTPVFGLQRTLYSLVLASIQPPWKQQSPELGSSVDSCDRSLAIRFLGSGETDTRDC